MDLAVTQREAAQPRRIPRREHLADTRATVVADQIDLRQSQPVHERRDHRSLLIEAEILIRLYFGVSQPHQIERDTPTRRCEVVKRFPPREAIDGKAMDKKRHPALALLDVCDSAESSVRELTRLMELCCFHC